jgi:RNA polymerase sigma-70 factor (ECF subfamily)
MQDAWLGRLFVRFREKRDGKALAAVFDATARELIGVAAHLVPTVDQAEDVVQSTFQRALEHAERYDPSRSLKAWLYGILWREAAKLTRNELRAPDPESLAPRAVRDPEEEAAARELPESVRLALARLSSPYREVLEPVLLEERSAREVAARLDRSPGTVRVQLQRGLERLRRELAAARPPLAGRRALAVLGLAPLRQRVLAQAGCTSAAVPAASLGFLIGQLLAVAVPPAAWAGLALAGTAAGVALARGERPTTPPLAPAAEPIARATPRTSTGSPAPTSSTTAAATSTTESDAADAAPAAREPRATRPALPRIVGDPRVTGLVVDEAERALAEIRVLAEAENHYGYAETTTDERGRFAFGELAAGKWFFHADDERHAVQWWQTASVDVLEERDPTKVPDLRLVLRTPYDVHGELVDDLGAPVADAKVTLAIEWPAGAAQPLQGHLTQELASVTTDAEGAFTFARLGAGKWSVVLDHPACARTLAQLEVPCRSPRLVIARGLALEGTVSADGAPLAGVRVVGQSTRMSHLTMGDWETTTDDTGRFRIERIAPVGDLRLSAVPTLMVEVRGDPWASDHVRVYESARGLLPPVELEAFRKGTRKDEVVDVGRDWAGEAERAGKPFGDAAIQVRTAGGGAEQNGRETVPVRLSGVSPELKAVSELADVGTAGHSFERLAAGRYRLAPLNGGAVNYAPELVELGPGERREVVLHPGALRLIGRVTAGGEPVSSGAVATRSIRDGAGQRARGAIESGRYELAGLVPGSYELLVEGDGMLVQSFEVELAEPETCLDLELPPGRIEGKLAFERSSAETELRVLVFPYGWTPASGNRGVFLTPDSDGRFAARHLPPGPYVVSVRGEASPVRARVVTLAAGERVRTVELARDHELGTLAGRITNLAAVPRGGATIAVLKREPEGLRPVAWLDVDDGGSFRGDVEPGRHALLVSAGPRSDVPALFVPEVHVEPGAATEVALTLLEARPVSIALDAHGAWTPRSIWRLRMPSGEWLSFVNFIGSEPEGRRASARAFALPLGSYAVEADFGDPTPVVREFTVVPGDGVQEVVVSRP